MMDRDPVSGNEIPAGGTPEGVRDDIDAKLSEGEYVLPADVVRFLGVDKIEKMVQKAQAALEEMDANGRVGGELLDTGDSEGMDDMNDSMEPLEMAEGGLVSRPSNFNPQQYGMGFMPFNGQMTPTAPNNGSSLYGPYTPKPTTPADPAATTPTEAPAAPEVATPWLENRDGDKSYEQEPITTDPNSWMDKWDYAATTPEGLAQSTLDMLNGKSGLGQVADKVGALGDAVEGFAPGLGRAADKFQQNPLGTIGNIAGALTGNPMLGTIGTIAGKGMALGNVSQANANAALLEAQGYTELAQSIRDATTKYATAAGVSKAAETIASGKQREQAVLERFGDSLFSGSSSTSTGSTSTAGRGTSSGVSTSGSSSGNTGLASSSGGLTFGGSNNDGDKSYEQDRGLSFGSSVTPSETNNGNTGLGGTSPSPSRDLTYGGSTGSSSGSSTGSFGTSSSGLDMGSTSTPTSNSVSTSAGDLDMGTSVSESSGYSSSGRDGYSYGLKKGGLVSKPKMDKMKQEAKKAKKGLGRK